MAVLDKCLAYWSQTIAACGSKRIRREESATSSEVAQVMCIARKDSRF
jgi:hypothetical protein